MTLQDIKAHCLSLPGAELSIKWGDEQCYCIAGKMFAVHEPAGSHVYFKCSNSAFEMLIEAGIAEPAPHLARAKWVALELGRMSSEELQARLIEAYALVRAKLPKKVQVALPPFAAS